MGSYTKTQFAAHMLLRFGGNSALSTPTDYLTHWVNAAYRHLTTSEHPLGVKRSIYFPELETTATAATSDGVAYVSVPTDCLVIREIYDATNNTRLDWISWPAYIEKTDRADTTAESTPSYWHRSGGYIYIYPTPAAAYNLTVHYKKRVTDLSGASEVTAIGKEWDDIILEMAVWFGRNWMNEPERAEFARKMAVELISGLTEVYDTEEMARRETLQPDYETVMKPTY